MKRMLYPFAILTSAVAAHAATIGFDSLPTGSKGDPSLANSYGLGQVSFSYAVLLPDSDPESGDSIEGTTRWRSDTSSGIPQVSIGNPLDFGHGSAPSGTRALNGLDQPVLLYFEGQSLVSFRATLDRSARSGNASAFQDVLFLNDRGGVVQSQSVDFTKPLNSIQASGLVDVSMVMLPAGKFYDNVTFATVPEPGTVALSILGGVGVVLREWRRKRTRR